MVLYTSPIEADDASFPVEHHHQRPHRIEDRRRKVPLLLQRSSVPLSVP